MSDSEQIRQRADQLRDEARRRDDPISRAAADNLSMEDWRRVAEQEMNVRPRLPTRLAHLDEQARRYQTVNLTLGEWAEVRKLLCENEAAKV